MKKRKDTMLTMMLASTMVANTAIPAYAVTSEDITKDGYTENNAEDGGSVIVDASGEDKEETTASHVDVKDNDSPGVIAMSAGKGEATVIVEEDVSVDNSESNKMAYGVYAESYDGGKSNVSVGGDVSAKSRESIGAISQSHNGESNVTINGDIISEGRNPYGAGAVTFGGKSSVSVDGDIRASGENSSIGVIISSSRESDMNEMCGGSDEEAEDPQSGESSVTVGGKIESSAMGSVIGIGYNADEGASANVKAGQVSAKSEYWNASGISNDRYTVNVPVTSNESGNAEIEVEGIEAEGGYVAYGIQNKVNGGDTKITVGENGITAKGNERAYGYENIVSSGTSDTKVHGDINTESGGFASGIMNEAKGSVEGNEEVQLAKSNGEGEADAENEAGSAESSIHVDGDVNIKKTLKELPGFPIETKMSPSQLKAAMIEDDEVPMIEDGEEPSILENYPEDIMYRIGSDGAVGIANGAEGGKASAEVDGSVNIDSEGGIVGAGIVNGAIDGKADTKVAGDVTVSMKDGEDGERGSSAGIVNVSAAEFSDVAEEIISELTEEERYAEFSGYSEASVNVDGSVKLDGGKKSAGVLNIGVGGKSNVNVGGDVDVDSIVKGVGVANLTTADGDTNTAVAGSVNVTSDLPYGVIINGGTMVIDGNVSVKSNEANNDNAVLQENSNEDESEFSIIRDLNNGAGVIYGNRGDLVIGGDIDASASDKSSAITIVPVVAKQADKSLERADGFVWQSFVGHYNQQPQDGTEESARGIPSEPIMTMAQQNNESDENADGDLQETASNGQITVLGTIKGNDGNAAIVVNVTKIKQKSSDSEIDEDDNIPKLKQSDNENNSSDANGIIGIAKEFSNMLYNDGEEIRDIDNAEEAFANVPTIVAHALEGEVAVHMDDDEAVSEEEANAAKQVEENIYYIIEYDENLANGKITISKYEKDFSVEMSDGSTKDVYTARQDRVVTITIVPDENYEVDESGLTSNTEAKLVRVGDTNDYELTIPKGGGIHISALFKEIEKEEEPVDPVDPDDKDDKDDENKQNEGEKEDSSDQGGNQGGSQDGKQDDGKQDGNQSGGQDDGNQDGKQNDGSQDGKQDDGSQSGSQDGKQDDSKKDDSKQEDKQDQSDEGKQTDTGTEENTDKETDPVKQDTGKKGVSGGHSGIRSSGGGSSSGGSGGGGGSRNNANNPNPTYPGSGNNGVANLGLWEYTNDGHWHVKTSAGGNFQDGWLQVDNPYANENQQHKSWFMFKDGNMLTGWVQDKGEWYYLNPTSDNTQGMMMTGWQWINGHCYYLDPASGKMLSNTVTPDGFTVDAEGHWTVNGVPQYREVQA